MAGPEAEALQKPLSRFSKYCSARGIAPQDVTQKVYERFYDDLDAHCLIRSPRETQQASGHAWNAARQTVEGWPEVELTIRNFRRNPSLPWTVFPASFQRDVDDYLLPRSGAVFDLAQDVPVLREATIASRKNQLRQFATAVVESGRSPESIRSLADLVEASAARAGLEVLLKRSDRKTTGRIHNMAYLLLSIARHWVEADADTLKALGMYCRNLSPKARGMTPRNKRRLNQFDNSDLLTALLELPARMMAEACREVVPTVADARMALLAVAIEIVTMAPLRAKNLAELELGRTLILDGIRAGHIVIDRAEVKNEVDIEIPLPASTLRMIEMYRKSFRPLLAPPGCNMLFPSHDGGHKRSAVLSHQISQCIRRRCGIEIHCHLFRHLAAKIYLDAFPGSYGIIRMLLGHKSIATTIKIYCGMEFAAAYRCYDELIDRRREGGGQITEAIRSPKGRG